MPISKKQVKHIAGLARLNLTPKETEQYTRELTAILDYIDQLKVVDTEGIELDERRVGTDGILREDMVTPSLPRDKAMMNAPFEDDEYFHVPRVLDK
ncbi:MAG: Asp-tRNA(Asn)/Glu-tRNA(Gln) amidotransferase subunit GatC [Candidatus Zixiibacteriota bacterium]